MNTCTNNYRTNSFRDTDECLQTIHLYPLATFSTRNDNSKPKRCRYKKLFSFSNPPDPTYSRAWYFTLEYLNHEFKHEK